MNLGDPSESGNHPYSFLEYVPGMTRRGEYDGEVVTIVVHRLGVIDIVWKEHLDKWTWLRVRRSFLGSG